MMLRPAACAALGLATACAPGAGARAMTAASTIDRLGWMVGCWTMETPRGVTITERWHRAARDTLAGTSRTMRGETAVASEVMHIFVRGDTLVFAALPSGQTYTEFRASAVGVSDAVFDNPAHDYPQRVSYRAAGDSLYGRIEGTSRGSFRSTDFPMRRTACQNEG